MNGDEINIGVDLGYSAPCAMVLRVNKVCGIKDCAHKKRNGRCELEYVTVPTTGRECWSFMPKTAMVELTPAGTTVIEDDGYPD